MKLNKNIFPLLLSIVAFSACNAHNPSDEPGKEKEGTISYAEDSQIIINPERGWMSQVSFWSNQTNVLTEKAAKNWYDQNVTMLQTMYYMPDFVESDISDEFLQRLEKNMLAMRAGGIKCIPRFAYSDGYTAKDKPWDASPKWVLRHIEQLAPYFKEYGDVILCLQAGFIGSWGEWYYTENFDFNPSKPEQYASRRTVIDALLNAMPKNRMVCLRTPKAKLYSYGLTYADTLTAATAFNESDMARLGCHNDCFVASSNDVGTYTGADDRAYWETESRYTVMGGETCGTSGTRSQCDNTLKEMARYHWTYINRAYHLKVIASWREGKCWDEITKRLGYRLVLTKGWFTPQPKAGQTFTAELKIKNVGFAAPVNPRAVQLVLVSKANTSKKYVFKFNNIEPRRWFADGEYAVNLECTLPSDISGAYNVYLNLPDPELTLIDKPAFSIRLANKDMWEEETGYNKLCEINVE